MPEARPSSSARDSLETRRIDSATGADDQTMTVSDNGRQRLRYTVMAMQNAERK